MSPPTNTVATVTSVDSDSKIVIQGKVPTGTVVSGWSVMANTMVGTGVLGLSSAFAQTGWSLGFVMMVSAALGAVFTLHLLKCLSMRSKTQEVS
ncbi:hypothetical protein, partial [Salmonella sp. s51944]|uniref:hypothetical protein n=1 Tax=Salmonella sp. s51944 TaxID=3159655 RepID=UPI0039814ABC